MRLQFGPAACLNRSKNPRLAQRKIVCRDASIRIESRLKLFKTALVLLQMAYIPGIGAMAADAGNGSPVHQTPAAAANPSAPQSPNGQASPGVPAAAEIPPALSPEAERVSQIAVQNGDRDFIMVDKANGELILFQNGKPIFSGPALTGAAMGDRIPPVVLTFTGTHKLTLEQKVTPAGRFTATPEADPSYGRVWTLNEIHGKDWDFAIHQVYLGFAGEHRDARLHSENGADHHITFGCINVEPRTIQALTRALPAKGKVPLYILPNDESLVAALFPLREQPSNVAAAAPNDRSH